MQVYSSYYLRRKEFVNPLAWLLSAENLFCPDELHSYPSYIISHREQGMETTSLVFCLVLALGSCVNTGRRTTGKRPEIAYGTLVDYPSIKRSYPYIARLNLDGYRCGGALIADR